MKLSNLIKKINKKNAPPDGWRVEDSVQETVPHVDIAEANKDRPEPGKQYALTGAPGSRCIANGYSWKDSEVTDTEAAGKSRDRGAD